MTVGESCWRRVTGAGPRVVLVHGTMDRSSSFGRMARVLPAHEVVRYDRRGYGHSVELGPPASFQQQVDDLLAVIDDHALVFGHSYGGTIAVAAAQRDPHRVRGVIAYESPMPWMDWWPTTSAGSAAVEASTDPADAAERFMIRMIGEERWRRLPPSTRRARRAEGETLVAEMRQMRPPSPPGHDPTQVTVPVIAAHGDQSKDHHRRTARTLAELAPAGHLRVVEGASHGVHLTHPTEAVALLLELETMA